MDSPAPQSPSGSTLEAAGSSDKSIPMDRHSAVLKGFVSCVDLPLICRMVKKRPSPPSFIFWPSLQFIFWELKTGKWTSYVIKVRSRRAVPTSGGLLSDLPEEGHSRCISPQLEGAQVCGQGKGSVDRGNGCPDDAIGQLCISSHLKKNHLQ